MNLAQIVKMDLLLNRISNVFKEDATMQVKIPQLVTLVCTLLDARRARTHEHSGTRAPGALHGPGGRQLPG